MSKKNIIILSLVMACAIIGLIVTQSRYFQTAYQLKEAQFGYAVSRALSDIVSEIEEKDKLILAEAGQKQRSQIDSLLSFGSIASFTDSVTFGGAKVTIGGLALSSGASSSYFGGTMTAHIRDKFNKGTMANISFGNGQSFYWDNGFVEVPIENRIRDMQLRELIAAHLEEKKIDGNFEYAIKMGNQYIHMSDDFYNKSAEDTYCRKLFLRGLGSEASLCLTFSNLRHSAWSTVGMMLPSFVITIIIVLYCLFCLLEIMKQKKLSSIKNDFINNMTHELKTPIATISLASQMLKDGSVSHAPESIHRIAGIVHDESKRLTSLVEKVLQSALFTETRMKLKKKSLHVNSFIEDMAQKFALRVEGNGGELYTYLEAESDEVYVDEMHFTNVISNILDNAIKYCERKPEISIYSRNRGNNILVSIVDNGIGIAPRDLKMIFERFYRVSTGNRHDVKGFGLGLSYVKTIVEAHGGRVSAESQEGKGTRFDILLPLMNSNIGS